jgi:hypothetical protein
MAGPEATSAMVNNVIPAVIIVIHALLSAGLLIKHGVSIPTTALGGKWNYFIVSSVVLLALAGVIVNKAPDKDPTEENADKIALLLIAATLAVSSSSSRISLYSVIMGVRLLASVWPYAGVTTNCSNKLAFKRTPFRFSS